MTATADLPGTRVRLCQIEEISVGLGRAFEIAGRSIAVFRTRSGDVFALDNACPHRGAPLADGMLAAGRVVCPFHAFRFDLTSGECDQLEICPVATYPARLEDGWVVVAIPQAWQPPLREAIHGVTG